MDCLGCRGAVAVLRSRGGAARSSCGVRPTKRRDAGIRSPRTHRSPHDGARRSHHLRTTAGAGRFAVPRSSPAQAPGCRHPEPQNTPRSARRRQRRQPPPQDGTGCRPPSPGGANDGTGCHPPDAPGGQPASPMFGTVARSSCGLGPPTIQRPAGFSSRMLLASVGAHIGARHGGAEEDEAAGRSSRRQRTVHRPRREPRTWTAGWFSCEGVASTAWCHSRLNDGEPIEGRLFYLLPRSAASPDGMDGRRRPLLNGAADPNDAHPQFGRRQFKEIVREPAVPRAHRPMSVRAERKLYRQVNDQIIGPRGVIPEDPPHVCQHEVELHTPYRRSFTDCTVGGVNAEFSPTVAVCPFVQSRPIGNKATTCDRFGGDSFFEPAQTEFDEFSGLALNKGLAGEVFRQEVSHAPRADQRHLHSFGKHSGKSAFAYTVRA